AAPLGLRPASGSGPLPGRLLVVAARRDRGRPLPVPDGVPVEVVPGRAGGLAGGRNLGWRRATAEWVAFLDDDVVPGAAWLAELARDLDGLPSDVAASQGRVVVPMPGGGRPADWERNVRGLEMARWATADMAYRREVLVEVGGFDERFPRAYREDADLGLRVVGAGYRIVDGRRGVTHPVRPAGGGGGGGPGGGAARAFWLWGVWGGGVWGGRCRVAVGGRGGVSSGVPRSR